MLHHFHGGSSAYFSSLSTLAGLLILPVEEEVSALLCSGSHEWQEHYIPAASSPRQRWHLRSQPGPPCSGKIGHAGGGVGMEDGRAGRGGGGGRMGAWSGGHEALKGEPKQHDTVSLYWGGVAESTLCPPSTYRIVAGPVLALRPTRGLAGVTQAPPYWD